MHLTSTSNSLKDQKKANKMILTENVVAAELKNLKVRIQKSAEWAGLPYKQKRMQDCNFPRGGEIWINHMIACILYAQLCVQLLQLVSLT